MGSNPSFFNGSPEPSNHDGYDLVWGYSLYDREPDTGEEQSKRPVEEVSWYDAIVFCNKLSIMEGKKPVYTIKHSTNPDDWGTVPNDNDYTWDNVQMIKENNGYRLPTEAEWEYACRAGTTTAYNTGLDATIIDDEYIISDDTGWYKNNSGNMTHEVGKKPANHWKLYDMHGNVAEWVWDYIDGDPTVTSGYDYKEVDKITTDPNGMYYPSGILSVIPNGRFVRGGCYPAPSNFIRSASRDVDAPYDRSQHIGFRVMRTAP